MPVGLTKDAGWQIGVRRTVPLCGSADGPWRQVLDRLFG
jgi:hypothetical protein